MRSGNGEPTMTAIATITHDERALLLRMERCRRDVMALFSLGLGFYGLRVYVATLQRIHGGSASAVSAPVTVYYVAGALLTMVIGVATLGSVTQPGKLYPPFLVLSLA